MKRIFQRGLWLIAFTLGLVFHLTAQSAQMTIYMNDGTERSYEMTESDRVYFEDNESLVVEIAINAKTDRINLADIRKITCSETEGVSESTGKSNYFFPNPVHNVVVFPDLNGKETVHIYALDGRLVKSLEATANQLIDISDLSIGLYLVKTETQTFKMIKL